MIGSIQLKVSSHCPQMPLPPVVTFIGSASNVRILDVPKSIGDFKVDSVKVLVVNPDNTRIEKVAVRVGSVYVATISPTEISGKTRGGFEVIAYCTDEDGQEAGEFLLGKGDYIVLERDSKATKDIEKFYVKFSDELPVSPSKGDMMVFNGSVRIFNGTEWIDCGKNIERLSQLENDVGYITQAEVPTPQYIENDLETYRLFANGDWLYRTRDFITGEFGPWQPLGDLCTEQTAVELAKEEG